MKPKTKGSRTLAGAGLASVREICARLPFEPHDLGGKLDARGRYEEPMDEEFPFLIKLFHCTSQRHTGSLNWHERLELFMSLDGPVRFCMGEEVVELECGDLLVVDNLRLHGLLGFPGLNTRVVVVSFLPEYVYSLGSPSHDYTFLLPFYCKAGGHPHVVRATAPAAAPMGSALARLLECYFIADDRQYFRAGSKVYLLEMLYHLARHFRTAEMLKWEFIRQQQRSLRLKPLLEYIRSRYAGKLTVREAAALVHMSQPRLMKAFKEVAGMSLIAYLTHVRLANAARLLRETALSVAEIAYQVGFADQSHFGKHFRRAFGQSPKEYRIHPK